MRFFRGSNQTRTGVNGFADRYLTTRTWNPFVAAKLVQIFESAKFSSQFSGKISGKNLVRLIIQCGAVLLSGRRCSVIGAELFCYRGGAVPLSGRRCSIIRAALFCYPGGAVLLSGRRCSVIGAELFRYRGGAVPLSGRSCSVIGAELFCYPGGAVPLSGRRCSVIGAELFCYPAKPGFYFKESRIDSSSTPLTSTARGLPPWLGPTIPACSSWSMIRPARL